MSAPAPLPEGGRAPVAPAPSLRQGPAPPRQVDSAQLFAGAGELHIVHAGQLYRLRRTALGKLILTK